VDPVQQAVDELSAMVELLPGQPDAYYHRARRDFGSAITECQKAIKIDPGRHISYCILGTCYLESGHLEKAVHACRRAIEIDATCPRSHNKLGIALARLGRYDEALKAFFGANKIESSCVYRTNAGLMYGHRNEYEEAYEQFVRALELNPGYRTAVLTLERAAQLPVRPVDVHSNLAWYRHCVVPDLPSYGSVDAVFADSAEKKFPYSVALHLARAVRTLATIGSEKALAALTRIEAEGVWPGVGPSAAKLLEEVRRRLADSPEPAGGTPPEEPVVVYTNDFESTAGSEWSAVKVEATPEGGRKFLGQFGNETVRFALNKLPAHRYATVSFDLFVIRSWDGNSTINGRDLWELSVEDGPTLVSATFASGFECEPQSYPDFHPLAENRAATGASERNSLGYTLGASRLDTVYRIVVSWPHAAPSLVLAFSARGLESLENESWGIDNIRVEILPGEKASTEEELNALWKKLGGDPMKANEAARQLILSGDQAAGLILARALACKPSEGLAWTTPEFDDSSWEEGPSGFGYGDNDDATILSDMRGNYTTVYIRRTFELSTAAPWRRLVLSVYADDGYVVYLNGKEQGRARAGPSNTPLGHEAVATLVFDENWAPDHVLFDARDLRRGTNVVAVQGINAGKDSSDLSLIPVLRDDTLLRQQHPEALRLDRAIRVLEIAGSQSARDVLASLAEEEPWPTGGPDVRGALKRVEKRLAARPPAAKRPGGLELRRVPA